MPGDRRLGWLFLDPDRGGDPSCGWLVNQHSGETKLASAVSPTGGGKLGPPSRLRRFAAHPDVPGRWAKPLPLPCLAISIVFSEISPNHPINGTLWGVPHSHALNENAALASGLGRFA